MPFVYVFTPEDRDRLLEDGFGFIRSDENESRFLFANRPDEDYDWGEIPHVFTDVLCF